jgi:hypothetical protein
MRPGGPRLIRAAYSSETITVYQAYPPDLADAAVQAGTLVPPFRRDRMTWIKPSFGWMMHRSGWAAKPGQERILSIVISRAGFEWALDHACLSAFTPALYNTPQDWADAKAAAPVRVQWDPDRSLAGERLPRRAIQVGLSGPAVQRYVDEWITSVTDITDLVWDAHKLVQAGQVGQARREIPAERVYPVDSALALRIGADPGPGGA